MANEQQYDGGLRDSWSIEGSYYNRMIDCGREYNQWVENALAYLPTEVLEEHKERLVFICTSDACRVARTHRENREIIFLADGLLPKQGAVENQPDVRYFIFAVLHEIVHAIKDHKSPKLDSLSERENAAQELEADGVAMEWFNRHVAERANTALPRLTQEELDTARTRDQVRKERVRTGQDLLSRSTKLAYW